MNNTPEEKQPSTTLREVIWKDLYDEFMNGYTGKLPISAKSFYEFLKLKSAPTSSLKWVGIDELVKKAVAHAKKHSYELNEDSYILGVEDTVEKLKSAPTEPDGEYWKKRCEAAEQVIYTGATHPEWNNRYNKWEALKSLPIKYEPKDDKQDEAKMENEIPRRIRMGKWTPAEKSIYDAMQEVEKLLPDTRHTEAVVLLSKAKDLIADVVDEKETHSFDKHHPLDMFD